MRKKPSRLATLRSAATIIALVGTSLPFISSLPSVAQDSFNSMTNDGPMTFPGRVNYSGSSQGYPGGTNRNQIKKCYQVSEFPSINHSNLGETARSMGTETEIMTQDRTMETETPMVFMSPENQTYSV